MKKTLLLSVVASTMIMAGGDIAPVEPIVVPAPVVASAWNFEGNAVAYYQTRDRAVATAAQTKGLAQGAQDLFGTAATDNTQNNFAVQLRAMNNDMFWGIGAGVELTGIASVNSISDRANGTIQTAGTIPMNHDIGAALTQAYLTYGIEAIDTSIKIGRQTLPQSLSPFAFSEQWQPVQNTFDAALVVNSSIPDTTLVYAFVDKSNRSVGNLETFNKIGGANGAEDGVHMITAQNKSIDGLTLTGSFYIAPSMLKNATKTITEDAMVAWGDAQFAMYGYNIGVQGGSIITGENATLGHKDTMAYGAKIGGKWDMFDLEVAYSAVDEGSVTIHNFGTGVRTPLYTQLMMNENAINSDATAIVVKAGLDALGGRFGVDFGMATDEKKGAGTNADSIEVDVSYKTAITENTTLFAAYVYTDADATNTVPSVDADAQNMVRVWARYNFN